MIEFDVYKDEDENFYRGIYFNALSKYDRIISKASIISAEQNLHDEKCSKIIVKNNGDKIGIIAFFVEKSKCHVSGFAISEKFTGSGIGSKVLNELEIYLQDLAVEIIILSTMKENFDGIKFYLRNGYEIIDNTMFYPFSRSKFEQRNIIFFRKSVDKNILVE